MTAVKILSNMCHFLQFVWGNSPAFCRLSGEG